MWSFGYLGSLSFLQLNFTAIVAILGYYCGLNPLGMLELRDIASKDAGLLIIYDFDNNNTLFSL